jgi:hypothetical protein
MRPLNLFLLVGIEGHAYRNGPMLLLLGKFAVVALQQSRKFDLQYHAVKPCACFRC